MVSILCHYGLLCDNLHPSIIRHIINCFMVLPPDLLFDAIFQSFFVQYRKMPYLTGTPPHVYLTANIDSKIAKPVVLSEEVVGALKM